MHYLTQELGHQIVNNWYPIGQFLRARDLWVEVPIDWNKPTGKKIRIFAREVVDASKFNEDLPLLLFLQGGPGGKSPRPLEREGWIGDAVKRFRVILPDQRGTGRSTPLSSEDFVGLDAQAGAELLALHRVDSIVRDFEHLRQSYFADKQWWTLGQSYGGFLTLQYLSHSPDSLVACAITGGLPSLDPDPEVVYQRTYPRIAQKNRIFQERYPHLIDRISRVAQLLEREEVLLPSGDRLTVRRLQTLGLDFGYKVGFDHVHWVFDEAFTDAEETRLSQTFLTQIEALTGFATEPLFIALQEAIYGPGPSNWAAERERKNHPEFETTSRPLYFTGETFFPWMFEEVSALKGMKEAVNFLASNIQPIDIYTVKRLANNKVPIEAAVYYDDMFVDAQLSLETAAQIPGLHAWVTNEHEHDGIQLADVAERLFTTLETRLGGLLKSRPLNK